MATVKCPYCAEEIQAQAVKCKHCGSWIQPPPPGAEPTPGDWHEPPSAYAAPTAARRLVRSSTSKMLAGVCGGLGAYLGMDPTLLRVIWAVATFFTGIVPGLILYVILALVVPSDDAPGAWT